MLPLGPAPPRGQGIPLGSCSPLGGHPAFCGRWPGLFNVFCPLQRGGMNKTCAVRAGGGVVRVKLQGCSGAGVLRLNPSNRPAWGGGCVSISVLVGKCSRIGEPPASSHLQVTGWVGNSSLTDPLFATHPPPHSSVGSRRAPIGAWVSWRSSGGSWRWFLRGVSLSRVPGEGQILSIVSSGLGLPAWERRDCCLPFRRRFPFSGSQPQSTQPLAPGGFSAFTLLILGCWALKTSPSWIAGWPFPGTRPAWAGTGGPALGSGTGPSVWHGDGSLAEFWAAESRLPLCTRAPHPWPRETPHHPGVGVRPGLGLSDPCSGWVPRAGGRGAGRGGG